MTRYLVEEKQIFASNPVIVVDVGARAGVNAEWAVFGDQARIYCFEPEQEECARLAASAPAHVTYIPAALGAVTGQATLYESRLAFSTGLYKTRMEYFGRFTNRDNGEVVAEHTIFVKSLRDAMRDHGIPQFDFIKLDTEGAELDILKGGGQAISSPGLLGVLSEIRLHAEINGSPPFSSLDAFLQAQGFRLYDLSVNHHSRTALPYPQLYDYRLPSGKRFYAYTTHGQLQDGDALYFRDLFGVPNLEPLALLKLCCFLEIYCLSDCAAELIVANREGLSGLVDPEKLLDLLARQMSDGRQGYQAYVEAYFSDSPAPAVADTSTGNGDAGAAGNGASQGRDDTACRCDSETAEAGGALKRLGDYLFGRKGR
ncbi:FkbM family methyltransferase [Enhydrobacter aerosaccus]|nr:FkbM family methyltransferase [Enhydrobacter aerosaccus]